VPVAVIASVRLYEEGLARALDADPRLRVVGSAPRVPEALARPELRAHPPRVTLLDDVGVDGASGVRQLKVTFPQTQVVALAVREATDEVISWARAGADGLVTRDASLDELTDCILGSARGEAHCSPGILGVLLRHVAASSRERAPSAAGNLTGRERQILTLIDEGLSNKEIASALRIGLPTVKNHVHHILDKLGVRRRAEAAAVLRAAGH
jgi:DNA-binding NarL/FixJ family response regulator